MDTLLVLTLKDFIVLGIVAAIALLMCAAWPINKIKGY